MIKRKYFIVVKRAGRTNERILKRRSVLYCLVINTNNYKQCSKHIDCKLFLRKYLIHKTSFILMIKDKTKMLFEKFIIIII